MAKIPGVEGGEREKGIGGEGVIGGQDRPRIQLLELSIYDWRLY